MSLAPENILMKDLTLPKINNNFTGFGWAIVEKTGDKMVAGGI